jgi:hypothetical protein
VEFHFGAGGHRLRGQPGFRMEIVPDADHTFSRPGNQPRVVESLLRHLDQRPPVAPAPAPASARVSAPDQLALRPPL